jgi:hypothetical protein
MSGDPQEVVDDQPGQQQARMASGTTCHGGARFGVHR